MSFPSRVQVGHKVFAVRYEVGLTKLADVTGGCMPDTEEVLIDSKLGPATERETILHELMHALWHMTLLEKAIPSAKQEDIIYTLAPGLLLMLRDNPELVDYLLEG